MPILWAILFIFSIARGATSLASPLPLSRVFDSITLYALKGSGILSEAAARHALEKIVNHRLLTVEEKNRVLDVLSSQVGNRHERGLAAPIVEDIQNEGTHLMYSTWRGPRGNWQSVQKEGY